jgi:hypothetical protein
MKKTLIILTTLFLVATAQADYLPDGCYVTYSNPTQCYVNSSNTYAWGANDRQDAVSKYGYVVESIMTSVKEKEALLTECVGDYADSVKLYNDAYNLANNNYIAAIEANRLAKKLRRACGSKCRRIK